MYLAAVGVWVCGVLVATSILLWSEALIGAVVFAAMNLCWYSCHRRSVLVFRGTVNLRCCCCLYDSCCIVATSSLYCHGCCFESVLNCLSRYKLSCSSVNRCWCCWHCESVLILHCEYNFMLILLSVRICLHTGIAVNMLVLILLLLSVVTFDIVSLLLLTRSVCSYCWHSVCSYYWHCQSVVTVDTFSRWLLIIPLVCAYCWHC